MAFFSGLFLGVASVLALGVSLDEGGLLAASAGDILLLAVLTVACVSALLVKPDRPFATQKSPGDTPVFPYLA